jgi:hypothetical protein
MKKIIKKSQEIVKFTNDFDKNVDYKDSPFEPSISININCGYGSDLDCLDFEFHCEDKDLKKILQYLQSMCEHNISENCNVPDCLHCEDIDKLINKFCQHHRILKLKNYGLH